MEISLREKQRIIWNIRHSNFGPYQYYQKTMLFIFGLISQIVKPKIIYCSYRSQQVHESAFFSKQKKEVIVNRLAKQPPKTIETLEKIHSYLLFVGRFNPQKGPKHLRAISKKLLATHTELELWIVGKGCDINFFPDDQHAHIKIWVNKKKSTPCIKMQPCIYLLQLLERAIPMF